jgi:hypothetical protein
MQDFVSPCVKEFRDQAAMATPPKRLGAHEAWRRLLEGSAERPLPIGGGHPSGIAAKRGLTEAAESFLTWLARTPAAELRGVPVHDRLRSEARVQGFLVELRVSPRPGKPAHVHERRRAHLTQTVDELCEWPRAVANRENAHTVSLGMNIHDLGKGKAAWRQP